MMMKMMTTMKKNKINIRPSIKSIKISATANPEESFQNRILRPIFKLQHDIIISNVAHYILRKGKDYLNLTDSNKETYLSKTLLMDQYFLNLLKGTIVGMMTVEEFESYKDNEQALNKRITSLLKKRLNDSQSEITMIIDSHES